MRGAIPPTPHYDVSKSFRTGLLERELQVVQLSATRCSCIAILRVSLVSFAAITLCVASHRVFVVVRIYFVIDSVRKLLVTPSYVFMAWYLVEHRDNCTFTWCSLLGLSAALGVSSIPTFRCPSYPDDDDRDGHRNVGILREITSSSLAAKAPSLIILPIPFPLYWRTGEMSS
jgi:hypothetical protein